MEENTVFVEGACQIYEVLVDDKQAGKAGGAGPSGRYDTWSGPKRNDVAPAGSKERVKGIVSGFRLISEIEKTIYLQKVPRRVNLP